MGLRDAVGRRLIGGDSALRVVEADYLSLVEASANEAAMMRRERDLWGYREVAGTEDSDHDLPYENRLRMVREAREAWLRDPLAGAVVDLMNKFVFGRGVPMPRARDPKVQEVLEAVWNDPDNQAVLTGTQAQIALGTDLTIQANLYVAFFDHGDDGKVKVGLVPHDSVRAAVRHPRNRQRILYFVSQVREYEWDFDAHRMKAKAEVPKTRYYEHWALRASEEESARAGERLPAPAKADLAKGRVYHIALNRTTEMAFGVPEFQRILPWVSSYNAFMAARVDMMRAAASLIMKAKAKGTPAQVRKAAEQQLTRRGPLGSAALPVQNEPPLVPPMNASTLFENESIDFQPLNLNSGAGQAAQDGAMIRSQVSASSGWPQHYLGASENAGLATATSLELPILKGVELRQELIEGLYRALFDRAIERAVETGVLSREPDAEDGADVGEAATPDDEREAERDLSYEFAMPNPLKRVLADLVSAATNVARSFDPNNTNLELSRVLLQIVLAEGFEVQDPAGLVKRIYPDGYVDPAVQAAQQAQEQGGAQAPPALEPGAEGADGDRHAEANPYGAPMRAQDAEDVAQEAPRELPGNVANAMDGRGVLVRGQWEREVAGPLEDLIASMAGTDGDA